MNLVVHAGAYGPGQQWRGHAEASRKASNVEAIKMSIEVSACASKHLRPTRGPDSKECGWQRVLRCIDAGLHGSAKARS